MDLNSAVDLGGATFVTVVLVAGMIQDYHRRAPRGESFPAFVIHGGWGIVVVGWLLSALILAPTNVQVGVGILGVITVGVLIGWRGILAGGRGSVTGGKRIVVTSRILVVAATRDLARAGGRRILAGAWRGILAGWRGALVTLLLIALLLAPTGAQVGVMTGGMILYGVLALAQRIRRRKACRRGSG